MWYIIPTVLGWEEIPKEQSPYIFMILILTVLTKNFTNRMRLEEKYAIAIASNQKMKSELDKILQVLPDSILLLSKSQKVVLFNQECQKLFGSDDSDKINENLKILKYSTRYGNLQGSELTLYEDIIKYLDSNSIQGFQGVNFGIVELDGHSYEWKGTKSEWDGDKIIILTARDISSIISYERAKAEAESKTILLRTVSHEIRTPTNNIMNLSDSLLEHDLNSKQREMVKIINISSKLLINLINDLLDFSKIIAECFIINKYDFELRNFISETYSLFAIQAQHKGIDYKYYIDDTLPSTVVTDPNRLRQIILNLLSNSFKFTLRGRILIEALLSENHTMLIKVSDTGIGIPQNRISQLFEPFKSTQDFRLNPQGCGLGLYISNKLAQALGQGSIQVTSKPNQGSVFSFEIDILGEAKSIIDRSETLSQIVSSSSEFSYKTGSKTCIEHEGSLGNKPDILIVDDNEFNLFVMGNLLVSDGRVFTEAKSGAEAVMKVLEANTIESNIKLVVMDYQMPEMSGPEASKEIHRLYRESKISHIPNIIGYSADESEEIHKTCIEAGMKDCIPKSSSKNRFINTVRKYL
jgi:signal transduction histidine kinase/CheY-like chemotaxis protein